jgi:predicted nucleic acid-binding protein
MEPESTHATRYLLDTSALVAYLANESGSQIVARCRNAAAIPFIALTELYYLIWSRKGRVEADFHYGIVKSWKLPILLPNERVLLSAGRLKAQYQMGIADSFVAALAIEGGLLLVTKDKDFQRVGKEVGLQWI